MKVLIIANSPSSKFSIKNNKYSHIVWLDGIANKLIKNLFPDIVLGDLDSISTTSLKYLKNNNVKIIKIPDQETTDLDKGINYADELGANDITILNAVECRVDHTLYNIHILKKYWKKDRSISIIHATEIIKYVKDSNVKIVGKINDIISIIPLPMAIVTSLGLKYELKNYELELGVKESISNSLIGSECNILIEGEALIIHNGLAVA